MASSKNDAKLDSARVLCYTPSIVGQLVAITSTSRMLKLEANTGQLISEVRNKYFKKLFSYVGAYIVASQPFWFGV